VYPPSLDVFHEIHLDRQRRALAAAAAHRHLRATRAPGHGHRGAPTPTAGPLHRRRVRSVPLLVALLLIAGLALTLSACATTPVTPAADTAPISTPTEPDETPTTPPDGPARPAITVDDCNPGPPRRAC
jgi:hypothetical protein